MWLLGAGADICDTVIPISPWIVFYSFRDWCQAASNHQKIHACGDHSEPGPGITLHRVWGSCLEGAVSPVHRTQTAQQCALLPAQNLQWLLVSWEESTCFTMPYKALVDQLQFISLISSHRLLDSWGHTSLSQRRTTWIQTPTLSFNQLCVIDPMTQPLWA